MLLEFYKALLARAISGAEENMREGLFTISDAIELAYRIETLNCAIEALEEYYAPEEETNEIGGM